MNCLVQRGWKRLRAQLRETALPSPVRKACLTVQPRRRNRGYADKLRLNAFEVNTSVNYYQMSSKRYGGKHGVYV